MSSVEVETIEQTSIEWKGNIIIFRNGIISRNTEIPTKCISEDPDGFVEFAEAIRDALKGKRKRKKQASSTTIGTTPENQTQITDEVPKRHRRTKAEMQQTQEKVVAQESDSCFKSIFIEDENLWHVTITNNGLNQESSGTTLRTAIEALIPTVGSIPAEFSDRERDLVTSILKGEK